MVKIYDTVGIDRCKNIWFGNPSNWAGHQIKVRVQERAKIMKKLYKVFVVENQGTVHEVNRIAESHQGAMFDAVKELGLGAKYDDLDVYALEIFTLKKRNCC